MNDTRREPVVVEDRSQRERDQRAAIEGELRRRRELLSMLRLNAQQKALADLIDEVGVDEARALVHYIDSIEAGKAEATNELRSLMSKPKDGLDKLGAGLAGGYVGVIIGSLLTGILAARSRPKTLKEHLVAWIFG